MAIAPIKITLKLDEDIVETKTNQTRAIILAIALGLTGALLNSFPIELAYSIFLVLGNLVFILAAAYLRPVLTLLCALICVAPLFIIWDHPFGFITFGCEALFVSYMRGRGWYLPTADFLYWLVIGMPLTALLIDFTASNTPGYLIFTLLKQNINGIFYTALGVILIYVFDGKLSGWIKTQQPPLVKNLKQYLQYVLWVMSASFVVGVCLFLSRSLTNIQDQQFQDKLDISSQYVGRIIERYVDEHKKAIAQVANELSVIEPNNYDDALIKMHKIYPGFLTMLIANKDGSLATSSPRTLMENLPEGFSVADRSYFSQAFYQQSLSVSSVFLGRGFGTDPIIAISAPIYANDNANKNNKPVGIVEGSLNLNLFEQVKRNAANYREIDLVLTDENNNVIYADANLALATLSKFNFTLDQANAKYPLLTIDTDGANKPRYLHIQSVLNNGWKIFVLIEHRQILALVEQQYLTIFISLFIVFILVIALANQFARTLSRPLAFALKELAHGDVKKGYKAIPYDDAPSEFLTLYNELQRSKERLLKQQFILENIVETRTKALNEANKALKKLVNKDSLTGLYNRRYLNNKFSELQSILSRNNAAMVVAMLDLDHFKKLNDEHGHLIGDNCLKFVGEAMQRKFDRRSDIVARFGGEEFIVVAQHDEQNGVLKKLEELREEIVLHCLPYDAHHFISVTISIGAVTANAKFSGNIDDWIRLADEQLYEVKNNGRNQLSTNHLANVSKS
ncbi:MAG: diguanylate cyclase (GGDEF)-like protein [Psychroserpens sp.]|jgi:diguanylate cyclase (GGDEF)-like protein